MQSNRAACRFVMPPWQELVRRRNARHHLSMRMLDSDLRLWRERGDRVRENELSRPHG